MTLGDKLRALAALVDCVVSENLELQTIKEEAGKMALELEELYRIKAELLALKLPHQQ